MSDVFFYITIFSNLFGMFVILLTLHRINKRLTIIENEVQMQLEEMHNKILSKLETYEEILKLIAEIQTSLAKERQNVFNIRPSFKTGS